LCACILTVTCHMRSVVEFFIIYDCVIMSSLKKFQILEHFRVWILSLYCCDGWGMLWHLHRLLQYVNYITHEFISSTILLHLLHFPPPNSWISFNRYHFCIFLHVHTFYCTVFTLLPSFPNTSPPHWCQPSPDFEFLN
jgi:hypothetical protein